MLPFRQPHLLGGKRLVETTLPLRCLFPGMWRKRAMPQCVGKPGEFAQGLCDIAIPSSPAWMQLCLSSRLLLDRLLWSLHQLQVHQATWA